MRIDSICSYESCKLVSIILISFLLFILILTSDISTFLKGLLSILLLLVAGHFIRDITKAQGWSGFILFKIKEGIKLIEIMNKFFGKWMDAISDFGLIFGFGISGIKLFRHIEWKTTLFSIFILIVFVFFIMPFISHFTISTIDIPQNNMERQTTFDSAIFSLVVLIIFGFVGFVILTLIANSISIISSLLLFLLGGAQKIQSAPGVSFVIPGITIPLIEGIIALIVLLIIHEGAHGIIAMRAKVKIKSSGLLLFGFIPVGAYVDVDEKSLEKKEIKYKLRVASSGAGANIVAAILFFIPAFALLL
ncbi:MAG: site-2 protease family protein, partial [Candidatus Micrarchaeota archaeon]|nr:site-2 protease family protein [Candidatus Micrarchaeota archaeon]